MVDHHTPERMRWLRVQSWKWRQTQPDDVSTLVFVASVFGLLLVLL